ncbi:diguanylate cyclase domain-containing protein [Azospirillum halopraeferens]|uniref:diguanylate cyclase domain-containing protein n=1 Tax=Azospirillum halopraeferens TaxID=34010 RepID=UPI0004150855|nr:diguanylate cyclase [Azospirillum halopraeferens]
MNGTSAPLRLNQRPSVLVVEDELGDATLIRIQLLERASDAFDVRIARSLAEAAALLGGGREEDAFCPDVVLLDLNLPDSTGIETVRRFNGLAPAVPIVVLTGLDDNTMITAALEAGAQDYLLKGEGGFGLRRAVRYAMLRHQRDKDDRLAATVFAVTDTAIAIVSPGGTVERVNPAFRLVTGLAGIDVIGKPLDALLESRDGGGPDDAGGSDGWRRAADGEVWEAEIWSRRPDGHRYCAWVRVHPVRIGGAPVEHYVVQINDITARKDTETELARRATHDHLTGLPNRFLLNDRVDQAIRTSLRDGTGCAVLFIDLDGFKPVNDTLGHAAGDRVLTVVARRLVDLVRASDTVARLGGDEFAILLPGCAGVQEAASVADKVLASLALAIRLEDGEVRISASVGIACYPVDGRDGATLIEAADAAMYRAKRRGKNAYALATDDTRGAA